jgi:hypothetical protein
MDFDSIPPWMKIVGAIVLMIVMSQLFGCGNDGASPWRR